MGGCTTVVLRHDVDEAFGAICCQFSAGDSGFVVAPAVGFDPASLEDCLRSIGANDRVLLIHVVGSVPADSLTASMAKIQADLLRDFPAVRGLRQWVVQLAGLRWDEDEIALARQVHLDHANLRLGGVLVAGRSTNASIAQTAVEEHVAAAGLITALRTCPELERSLAETPAVWLAGVAVVSYSPHEAVQEWMLRHRANLLERLAKSLGSKDTAFAEGRKDGDQLELGHDREQARLFVSPVGGSVLSEVRASAAFARTAFDAIPVGDWPQAIEAAVDEVQVARLPRLLGQVDRTADERLEELRRELDRLVAAFFEDSRNVPSTTSYVEGLLQAISDAAARLLQRRGESLDEDDGVKYERLRRLSGHLPYAAALMTRAFLGAVLALLLVVSPIAAWARLDAADTRLWARISAAIIIAAAGAFLAARWRRLRRARDTVLRAMEHAAVDRLERYVLDARIRMLESLQTYLARTTAQESDSWLDRLARLNRVVSAERRRASDEATGKPDVDIVSRYLLRLPFAPHLDGTAVQNADGTADEAIASALVAARLDMTEVELQQAVAAAGELAYEPLFDRTLGEHLDRSEEAARRVRTALGADLASAIGDEATTSISARVLRYLCVPKAQASELRELLTADSSDESEPSSPVSGITDVLTSSDPCFVALVHTIDVSALITSETVTP